MLKKINISNDFNPWWGVVWKIIAFACYAAINTLARYLCGGSNSNLEQTLPVNVIIFFQDSFALLFLLPWILHHKVSLSHPRFIKLHFARVIFSVSAIIAWYFALFFIPQAEAAALSIIGLVLGVIGAKWFLKEHIGMHRFLLILISFSVSLCVTWRFIPSFKAMHLEYGLGLGCIIVSAVLFAAAKLLTRQLAHKGESAQKLTAYLLILMVPFSFVPALFFWVTPSLEHIPWLALGGLLTTLAIYAVSSALTYAEVSFLAPFDFIQFILNAAMGYWIFTEIPSNWVFWVITTFLLGHLGLLLFKFNSRSRAL